MKILKWYSAVVIVFSTIGCFITGLTQLAQDTTEASNNLWGAVLFVPIAVYMCMMIKRKE